MDKDRDRGRMLGVPQREDSLGLSSGGAGVPPSHLSGFLFSLSASEKRRASSDSAGFYSLPG